mgnify:CR=1 FL=1
MKVLNCDVCLLDFFDYEGYEIREGKVVCIFCICEAEDEDEDDEED